MFTILSSEAKLKSTLQQTTPQERIIIKDNFTHVIALLSAPTAELLANRRQQGVLLPQESDHEFMPAQLNEITVFDVFLLKNISHLIAYINTLCLTEAVLVRDNFDNCLELPLFTSIEQEPKSCVNEKSRNVKSPVEDVSLSSNNISPIRINEVKNRLTQAIESSEQQELAIKEKLNALLTKTECTNIAATSEHVQAQA
ncbi:hypothetical protein [Colwellia sp. RSH04]|uniref:hypothetical protein n=1 Tax=Colwellia sp. RSH04 TaxID=2305464 RepID=UPI000E5792C6|nr:hypothetical protein [Colwellia sp. RSH04]RHW77776.1 hypothetical protein D1094_02260 [Colwellia sp. RSH04]